MTESVRPEPDFVLDVLREGTFDKLVGAIEWTKFECKKSPYQVERPEHKLELAKDVAAFANGEGGIILVGADTEIHESVASEVVTEIRPFQRDHVDVKQYLDVLKSWLYPPPRDIRIEWFQSATTKNQGLVAIHVPPADGEARPVLVTRAVAESGAVRGNIVGLFERHRDGVEHWNAQAIHTAMRSGYRQSEVIERLGALQASIDALYNVPPPPPVAPPPPAAGAPPQSERPVAVALAPARSQASTSTLTNISEVGLGGAPAYVLDAAPIAPVAAPGFFASRQSPFAQLVENPPEIRNGGFGIDAGLNVRMHVGLSWRSMYEDGNRLLEIAKNGTVRFAAPGGSAFLCWASPSEEKLLINPITLAESLYLYMELLRQLQGLFNPKNVGYIVTLHLYGLKSDRHVIGLTGGAVRSFWRSGGFHEARESYFSTSHTSARGEISPAVFAYQFLESIYERFGLTHDSIPYVHKVDGTNAVDIQQIRNARG